MSEPQVQRALVLSGGGGRGAYQVGVCRVLEELNWQPDLVLGNSIGATNGALLVAPRGPMSGAALLDALWHKELINDTLHQVSQRWPLLLHEIMSLVIRGLQEWQTPPERQRPTADLSYGLSPADLVAEAKGWLSEARIKERLSRRLQEGFSAPFAEGLGRPTVMERQGWHDLLERYVDFDKLNAPETPYLGIAATDAATGALRMFWNHVPPGVNGVASRLTPAHIMASSSIPGFYEATLVEGRYWWDGALIDNTPIGPALDTGASDIIVVLMTPWAEAAAADAGGAALRGEPPTVLDALDRFLDWMMLASFRSELRRLRPEERGRIRIIAPQKLQGLVSIIDYQEPDNATLIQYGMEDARAVLQSASPVAAST